MKKEKNKMKNKAKYSIETPEKIKNVEEDIIDVIIKFIKKLFLSPINSKSENKNKTNNIKINKKAIIYSILVIIIIFIFLAITYLNIKRQIKFNQKPELITQWQPQYKGQIGMPVFNEHQFIIDNAAKEIKIYKKLDGILIDTISVDFVPVGVAETQQGIILVKAQNSDNLYFYENKKLIKNLNLQGFSLSPNFNIDSEDNIYYANVGQAKILKYSLNGEKLLEFGSYGKTKDKFQKIGRIFLDKDNNLYIYDLTSPGKIKVFTSNGKFLKEINTGIKELKGWESIAVTHDGNIYINDLFELVIRVYSPKGKLLGKFKTDATGKYSIGIPNCLSGGIDNIIYVHTQAFRPIKY